MNDLDLFGPSSLDAVNAARTAPASVGGEIPPAPATRGLDSLGKFFASGALVVPSRGADAGKGIASVVRRMAAAGLVGAFSLTVAPSDADAFGGGRWQGQGGGYRPQFQAPRPPVPAFDAFRHRREERRDQRRAALAITGAVVAGAILANRGTSYPQGYGAYGQGLPFNPGYQGYPQYQARPAYPPAPAYGYGRPAQIPSDRFVLAAKTLLAADIGDVNAADAIFDRALNQGLDCTRRMGPSAACTVKTHGIFMDFSRGEFRAISNGELVVAERAGSFERIRPDILRTAYDRAMEIKRAEIGGMAPPPY